MGSGLILGGIGKGIAEAGAAYAGGMMKGAEFEMQNQRDEAREQRLEDRKTRELENIKQRVAQESAAVQVKAEEMPIKRAASEAVGKLKEMAPNPDEVMSTSEMEKYMKENPSYKKGLESSGIIGADKMHPALRRASDEAQAALEMGAHSSVIEAYSKQRSDVLRQISEEHKAERDEQRHQEAMANIGVREKAVDARAARANQPAADKPITGVDLERTAKAAERALSMQLGVPLKDVPETVARLKKQNKVDADTQGYLDEYNAALKEWQGYKRKNKPVSDNTPTPEPTTPPGQRPPLGSFVRP